MKQGYSIISIEAADIYRQEQENGVSVGYKMPESKSDAYFRLFKIYLHMQEKRTGKKRKFPTELRTARKSFFDCSFIAQLLIIPPCMRILETT